MKDSRSIYMNGQESFGIEKIVRELLWKGKRKRRPWDLETLDIDVKDGVSKMLSALGMRYPE